MRIAFGKLALGEGRTTPIEGFSEALQQAADKLDPNYKPEEKEDEGPPPSQFKGILSPEGANH